MKFPRDLLWLDCSAGAVVGLLMLLATPWLVEFYALPRETILAIAAANLIYASFSYSLARRPRRPLSLVSVLAIANIGWGLICLLLAVHYRDVATTLGVASLILEGLIVGGLGLIEWRYRHRLLGGP